VKKRESSMTDEQNHSIEALLGEDPGNDPERRAWLAAGIAAALDGENGPPAADAMPLAAYLDGGLNEKEKEAVYARLNASGLARIELASAISLLAAVEQAPQRPPAELMAHAGALLKARQKQRAPRQIWQWLSGSRVRLGFGFAFATLVAMVVWNPIAERATVGPTSQPATQGSEHATVGPTSQPATQGSFRNSAEAILGGDLPTRNWGAVAISRSSKIYGVAQGSLTRNDAEKAALKDCADRGGGDCALALSGENQCFAVASQIAGISAAAAAPSVGEASRQAVVTCNRERTEIWSCALSISFCSGH
jgi:hypothetical protein